MLESFRCLPVPALQSRPAQVLRDYPVKWFRKLLIHSVSISVFVCFPICGKLDCWLFLLIWKSSLYKSPL